jgi:endonuclease III-like uncharacterized protein
VKVITVAVIVIYAKRIWRKMKMNEKKMIECMAYMKEYCRKRDSCKGCSMESNCKTWDCPHPNSWELPQEVDDEEV